MGRIDVRVKISFTCAWEILCVNSSVLDTIRLGEIALAMRAAEALFSFSTSLETDLRTIITKTMSDGNLRTAASYYERHLKYYIRELRNTDYTIEEVYGFAYLLRMQKNPPHFSDTPP